MKSFLLGLIVGIIAVPVAVYVYFTNGHPPVAVADSPFPMERQIVHIPLETRIESQVQQVPPIQATAANLATGALIYRQQCAVCHGFSGHPSPLAQNMYPHAPQLWERHRNGAVGVSDDPPGETYWKIANGIRLTGMPAFNKLLNDTQMWQVTLLLSRANQPLPAGASQVLSSRAAPAPPSPAAAKPPKAAQAGRPAESAKAPGPDNN